LNRSHKINFSFNNKGRLTFFAMSGHIIPLPFWLFLILIPLLFQVLDRGYAEEIPEYYSGVRPMGMGDAFTGVANDENAVWTNPAGIARIRKARSRSDLNLIKFPNIIAGTNRDGYLLNKAYKSSGEKNVDEIIAGANDLADKPFWARAGVFPVALFNADREIPMAFGLLSNTTAKIVIPSDTPEVTRIEAISDIGAVLSAGFTTVNNRINVGFQTRPIARYAYEDRIPSQDLLNKDLMKTHLQSSANKSQAIALDAGMMMTLGDFWFPTFGAAILNLPVGCKSNYLNPFTEKSEKVCGTVYSGSFANDDALSTVDPMDLRLGLSITPRLSQKVALRLALDGHHLPLGDANRSYGLQGVEVSKLIHTGAELVLGNPLLVSPFSLRTGYSQGFPTAGLSVNAGFFAFDAAIYGRDVSSTSKPLADVRYLASVSLDF
jgi:hypothetical protein